MTIQQGRLEPGPSPAEPRLSGPDHTPTTAMPVTTAAYATRPYAGDARAESTPSVQALYAPRQSPQGPSASPSQRPGASLSPAPSSARHPGRRRRRRAGIIVALAGTAAAGVMAAAGIASGLFSYDAPERDRALPDDVRASAPDTSPDGEASPVEPSGAGGGGAPAPAPSGGAPSQDPPKSPSSSPSPSQSSGSPSASPSATPTQGTPSASASGGPAVGAEGADDSRLVVPKTLRLGDDDPEVTELQLRLRQLGIYNGDIDESYDSQVEQAVVLYQNSRGITKDKEEPGVYGPVTRERLESETKEP
ncbi:peptidoglycan-binding protein [Streptomyces sp. NPDC002787]